MTTKDRVVLVIGRNRGLGASFVENLINFGVKKYMVVIEVLMLSQIIHI
ncbi:hypothetical protein GIX45_26090 [Erwinia sp. CPCC 100877]|nr:hypothetical protein [Erwinia sp. CPCC 100877]